MRRLLFAAALLVLPAVARADTPYVPLTPWYGCGASGCFTVGLQAITNPEQGARYLWDLQCQPVTTCEKLVDGQVVRFFGADGGEVYSRGNGNLASSFSGTPTTGTLEVVGVGFKETVVLTTTPEPASMMLLGSGLVGLVAVRRKRRLQA